MSIFICGTVRNVGKYFDSVYDNMIKIASLFKDYEILLYYDKSDDNTLSKLMYYGNYNHKLSFYINNEPLLDARTERLAKGRNYLIQQLKSKQDKYPLFIMMDCDDVCDGKININLLRNSLRRMNEWDSLSFWGKKPPTGDIYYDVWALSVYPYILPFNYFQDIKSILNTRRAYYKTLRESALKTNKYIPCHSAFCGFAIYKTANFIDCIYKGDNKLDYIHKSLLLKNLRLEPNIISENEILNYNEDCEHRYFNFQSIQKHNSKIRISPHYLFA